MDLEADLDAFDEAAPETRQQFSKSAMAAVAMAGNNLAAWGAKRYQRTRERIPLLAWFVTYGLPMFTGALFILDIVRTCALLARAFQHRPVIVCTYSCTCTMPPSFFGALEIGRTVGMPGLVWHTCT